LPKRLTPAWELPRIAIFLATYCNDVLFSD
jgi:hypothetical protein